MDRSKSIELLNLAVAEELLSVHQYMYFHFHCDDRGYEPLAAIFKRISIAEMIHVEKLAERILFLKGDVQMKLSGAIRYINTDGLANVEDMLKTARSLEEGSINDYNKWANLASSYSDSGTKTLFEDIIKSEEDHFDIFDTEIDNLATFGDSYLSLQAIDRSRASGSSSSHPN